MREDSPALRPVRGVSPRHVAARAAAAILPAVALPGASWADEEESEQPSMLVGQAIALIVNDAGDARVAERIDDALQARARTQRRRRSDPCITGEIITLIGWIISLVLARSAARRCWM